MFGVNLTTSADPNADPVALATLAEGLGFDFVSCSDHPCGEQATNETWTLLTWVAARTTRIGIVTRVLGLPFRRPVVMAKMAETLHRLSGSRLVLGLGAGGSDDEIRAVGAPALSPQDKIAALEEALRIVRIAWRGERFSFAGVHHRADDAILTPSPRSPIPVWLGTFGRRALTITGQYGDGWIPSLGYARAEELPAMLERVLAAAVDTGRSPDEIERVLNVVVRVDDDVDNDEGSLVGPRSFLVDRLGAFLHSGFTGFNFIVPEASAAEQYHLLAETVVPALRDIL